MWGWHLGVETSQGSYRQVGSRSVRHNRAMSPVMPRMERGTMRFRRILFLNLSYPDGHFAEDAVRIPPLGIGYVAETLRQHNIQCRVVDLGLGLGAGHAVREVESWAPHAIAVSMMTFRYKHNYALLDIVRQACPETPIIAGGPHVSAFRQDVLEQCRAIDFGIALEGELPMLDLCEGRAVDEIAGLIHRKDGQVVMNPDASPVTDLDSIPFPKYEDFDLDRYGDTVQICSSRGCPYHCIFCQAGKVLGSRWRARSAANVAEEIQYWYDRGRRLFSFVDDNFTLKRKRVEELCNEIERRGIREARFVAAGVRADKVDRPLLARMHEVGFSHLAFGVESGSDRILKLIRKGERLADIDSAIRDSVDLGYRVTLYFVVGSPGETLEDVRESVRFALKYPIENAYFSNLMPIPGTELYDRILDTGQLLMQPEQYLNEFAEFERVPLFDAPGMTLEERKTALEITANALTEIQKRAERRHERARTRSRFARFGAFGRVFADFYSSSPGLAARRLARFALARG